MPYFVADGGERMVDLILLPIKDEGGRVVFLAPTGTDITDRKRAEERVRFQAHLLDTVGQAVIVTDPQGRITYWNRFAETLYGWGADEVTGRSILEILVTRGVGGPGRGDHGLACGPARAGPASSPVRRRDGTTFPAFVTDTPVFDERGSLKAIVGVSMDITERKRAEAVLKEADRRKDEFLATLAHELRNPLAPIRNALHLHEAGPTATAEMEAERAMAERQVVHLARLVDDLMDVARISRGKIELHKEVVDLATVVGQAVETARPQIDERRHRLTVSLPDGADPAGGRPDPAGAGPLEPAEQRRQVHRPRRPDPAVGRAARAARSSSGAGHGHRDQARDAAAGSSTCSCRSASTRTTPRAAWGSG